jgi:hypothetical protein
VRRGIDGAAEIRFAFRDIGSRLFRRCPDPPQGAAAAPASGKGGRSMLFGLFGKPRQPVATRESFDDFLDANGAYLVQRCLYEYARGAAAYQWQPLMEEPIFRAAMERSRWLAYPLGVAAVAEVMEGVIRPAAGARTGALLEGIERACGRVLGRHTPPDAVDPAAWQEACSDAARRVARAQLAAPRAVRDVAGSIAREVFALIPIVEQFRGKDPYLAKNNLAVALIAIHTEFVERADVAALAAALTRPG